MFPDLMLFALLAEGATSHYPKGPSSAYPRDKEAPSMVMGTAVRLVKESGVEVALDRARKEGAVAVNGERAEFWAQVVEVIEAAVEEGVTVMS
jgi:hypothetical protein